MHLKQRFDTDDLEGLSFNDAIRLVVAALEYAELIPTLWGDDSETREANIIKRFRDTGEPDYGICHREDGLIVFDFEGNEYELRTEDEFETYAANQIEASIEDAKYEWEKAEQSYYYSNYLDFNSDMMFRDMWMEKELYCSSYDDVVHECNLSCWDADGVLYRTGTTFYLWRTQ